MLQVDHLVKSYGTQRAVTDVSFRVARGVFDNLETLSARGKAIVYTTH